MSITSDEPMEVVVSSKEPYYEIYDLDLTKGTFHITGEELSQCPNIMKKLSLLHGQCGDILDKDSILSEEYRSGAIIFIDQDHISPVSSIKYGTILDLGVIESRYYNNISAFLTYFIIGETLAVYNVCTKKNFRGKKYASRLMAKLHDIVKIGANLWLGVDMSNPDWIHAVRTYARAGFTNLALGDKDLFEREIPFGSIQMAYTKTHEIYKPLNDDQVDDILRQANGLRLEYDVLKGFKTYTMRIEKETLVILHELVSNSPDFNPSCEVSCYLYPYEINDGVITLRIPKGAMVKGDSETFCVKLMKQKGLEKHCALANFHSHPIQAYIENRAYIGWPSYADINVTLSEIWTSESLFSIVASTEGIYFYSFRPEIFKIIKQWINIYYILAMANIIIFEKGNETFISSSETRKDLSPELAYYPSNEKDSKVDNFLSKLEILTLGDAFNAIEEMDESRIPILSNIIYNSLDHIGNLYHVKRNLHSIYQSLTPGLDMTRLFKHYFIRFDDVGKEDMILEFKAYTGTTIIPECTIDIPYINQIIKQEMIKELFIPESLSEDFYRQ